VRAADAERWVAPNRYERLIMNADPLNEALDKIQDIADQVPTRYKLPAAVNEALRIIEALARHRDNPSCVDHKAWLTTPNE
jgi:hypothetical protein